MKSEKAPPVASVRLGTIRASIWKNDSKNGARYNVTFDRSYRDSEENFCSSDTFGRDDLLTVAKVADLAHSKIFELQSAERAEQKEE